MLWLMRLDNPETPSRVARILEMNESDFALVTRYSLTLGIEAVESYAPAAPLPPGAALYLQHVKLDDVCNVEKFPLVEVGEGDPPFLIEWLKMHMMCVLGGKVVAAQAIALAPTDPEAAAEVLKQAIPDMNIRVAARATRKKTSATASEYKAMMHALEVVGNMDVLDAFLGDALRVVRGTHLAPVANWIHRMLCRFGWEALLPAMRRLVSRWGRCMASSSHVVDLLASLAGCTDTPACPRLELPFATECIKLLWRRLQTAVARLLEDGRYKADTNTLVKHILRLEHYWDVTDELTWFGARLPRQATAIIDQFRFGVLTPFLSQLNKPTYHERIPLSEAAVAVAAVRKAVPTLPCTKYVTPLWRWLDADTKPKALSVAAVHSLLWLAQLDTAVPLDEKLIERLWQRSGRFAVEGAWATGPMLPPPALALLVQYTVASAGVYESATLDPETITNALPLLPYVALSRKLVVRQKAMTARHLAALTFLKAQAASTVLSYVSKLVARVPNAPVLQAMWRRVLDELCTAMQTTMPMAVDAIALLAVLTQDRKRPLETPNQRKGPPRHRRRFF
ncbi:hypothetical protein SDRG_05157 [Saprolegnia diclina VS20]|uniref:Uncharacterized protein n=1 Tax=Saprolegnia diclina (strain VS20) TaxID=1156394 RepID=T0QHW3_SAPDV|nr:hypothetical protein SDRG_05157 [Saprolegnia diclina VS20]EQC37559.1 hypothetical protein SDRG_05157 [Saprolegnia diclina VS20]|eukprot:XP_008609079.1 hypothetical protein SDRG_05157 [Saprolegnia diclina VS20]